MYTLKLAVVALSSLSLVAAFTKTCPAGKYINDNGNCAPCEPGTYNPAQVTSQNPTKCTACPAGSFSANSGAKKCCSCCQGFFAAGKSNTQCTQCPAAKPFSGAGSVAKNDCTKAQSKNSGALATCDAVAANTCPVVKATTPSQRLTRRSTGSRCARGYEKCPHWSGRGGDECVDVANDPESCGGCVGLESTDDAVGIDCTSLPGVSISRCGKGKCIIDSCRKGFALSNNGTACTPNGDAHAALFQQNLVDPLLSQ